MGDHFMCKMSQICLVWYDLVCVSDMFLLQHQTRTCTVCLCDMRSLCCPPSTWSCSSLPCLYVTTPPPLPCMHR